MLTSVVIFVILCLFWQGHVVKRHALKQDVFSLFNGLFCISVRKREKTCCNMSALLAKELEVLSHYLHAFSVLSGLKCSS